MKINKNIFICALLVLMLFLCVNACSAEESLNETLGADTVDEVVVADAPAEELGDSGDTYVVDGIGEGGNYATISDAVGAATGGETIFIKNGEYTVDSTINFEKSLNVVGESKDGVSIKSSMPSSELFLSTTDGVTLSFSNLIIKDSSKTGGTGFLRFGSNVNADFTDCTFQNITNKYGVMQLSTTGTVNIENCKFNDIKCSGSNGAAGIYTSAGTTINVKNTLFDNGQFTLDSGQVGGVIFMSSASSKLYMDNVTIQNFNGPANSVVRGNGIVDIRKSKIVNNTVTLSSSGYVGESLFYIPGSGQLTIEQSIIADNNIAKNVFYFASGASATVNYNNIYNNVHDSSYQDGYKTTAGTLNADYNYWGSNDVPSDVVTTNHVVKNADGNYVLNTTGEDLEKEIPGLTDEGGDEPQPAAYDVYVSPDGDGDGSSIDSPTTLENALQIVPEGGSIFLCNGEYALPDAMFISQSVSIVGESPDGVILTCDQGFCIGNPEDPLDGNYAIDSISISSLTFDEGMAQSIFMVSCSVNELSVTDCIIKPSSSFMWVSRSPMGDVMDTTGTLNFKKNVLYAIEWASIAFTGNWDANINNNIFMDANSGENLFEFDEYFVGTIDANYNYWGSNSPTTPLEIDNWIVFNAASDVSEMYTDESAKITIGAYLNDDSDATSYLPDYPITASLSASGTLSPSTVNIDEGISEVTYTSDVARSDNVRINVVLDETTLESITIPITVKEKYKGIIYVDVAGSDDNEGSIDAPVATIGKAIELSLVDGGSKEIIINEGTYVGNGYHVTDDLTVTGNGKVTLDANDEGRFFYMEYGDSANKIELHNLILTNANGYGAAVYSFANELILDNVTIVNNQANGYLIKSNGKLTIKDSNITNSMSGNVIQQDASGDILINNTVFEDNSIVDTTSVMAVVNINSGSGNMVIENSKFINNTARQGIIKGNFNYNIDVKGSEFIDNTNTVAYGGAIYSNGGIMNVADSIFINNKAYRSGGAIYIGYRVTATVDRCIFINNAANTMGEDYYGDAIYNGNKLTVNNSVFLGDANNFMIYNDGEDNVVTAQNCWWGTNDDPSSLNGVGYYEDDDWEEYDCPPVDVSNWVTMDASFEPGDAQAGDEVTVTAVFSNANLPDGIPVMFASTSGNLDTVVSTVDAQASTTYTIDANDEAITATSGDATIEMPIADPFATNIVTNDTFYNFFDESGMLKDTVPYDELIFQGPFSDLAAGYVIITKPVTITGNESVLNDMGIVIMSEDVAIDNLGLIATTSLGDLIYVGASNVDLTNLIITYMVDDGGANVINIAGDEDESITDVNILNNSIYFESHATSDEELVTVINLNDVEDIIVDGNNITADYPGLYVGTYDWTYFMMGLCYVNPIRVYEAYTVELTNNNIDVNVNSYTGSYPTIQALYIVGSEDVLVKGNNVTMVDDLTPAGTAIYLYAIECGFSEGIEFIENNFNISTTGGQSGAGSAYAIQTATSEATFIGNNITCASNGPNLGIASMYGFGPAKDLVIKDNFLNITGYAAGSGDFALISGIEIQTGYATIYNNTIYVQNKGGYDDKYPVSGVSAIQYSANTLTFDIQDNEIYVPDGKYAVEFRYAPSEATVTGNTLYAHEFTGDASVSAKGDNNVVENNIPEYLTNIVTNDTFFKYFDENGILLDTITFDELFFEGDFSDLVDVITFNRAINVTSEDAVLDNIAINIASANVTLTGFTLNADKEFATNNGALIYANGEDIEISDVFVNYTAPSEAEAIAIYANAANNFKLSNSEIIFTGVNPGSNHYRGLEVRNSNAAKIDNNTINAVLPAVAVSWGGEGISQDLVLAVGIQGGNDVEFTNNIVNVNTNGEVGGYPTIDAVMVHSANDILIKGNNISHVDTTTEDGARYYYSLDIYSTTGTVEANNIIVNTTAGVDRAGTAYPIQLTGPFTVTIKDNNLTAISKGPIAGIYASNWGGPATLIVDNNNIDVAGYATTGNYALVAGIEAEIDIFKAYNNTITVANGADYDDANQVIGVGIGSSYFYGDTSADIKDNNITVDGQYAVYYANAVNTNVTGNTLYAHELEGNAAAVIESGDNNIIKDNLPVNIIVTVLSADDLEMSYGDGSAWTVTLTDADGNPIAGVAVKMGITVNDACRVYTRVTDENGVASLLIGLASGTYAVNATFEGDDTYEASSVNATVIVGKAAATLSGDSFEMSYKDGSAWEVTLTDANGDAIVGVKVAFTIENKTYHIKTDDDGVAKLAIGLLPGTYDLTASFSNSKYEAETIAATVTVNKAVPTLSAEDLVMNYKDGSALNVTLKDAAGNVMANTNVKFTIGTKTYTRKTNDEGIASLPIGLTVGNYTITAEFEGTSTMEAVSIDCPVIVNPTDYNLVGEDVNMTYKDGTTYNVQITDGDGNPVAKAGVVIKMTINGVSYNRKTNDEGIASLAIGLKAGTYNITAEYNGKEITNTIVVNRAA